MFLSVLVRIILGLLGFKLGHQCYNVSYCVGPGRFKLLGTMEFGGGLVVVQKYYGQEFGSPWGEPFAFDLYRSDPGELVKIIDRWVVESEINAIKGF